MELDKDNRPIVLEDKCNGCGACESVCPQHIEIVKELGRAAELFEEKPA